MACRAESRCFQRGVWFQDVPEARASPDVLECAIRRGAIRADESSRGPGVRPRADEYWAQEGGVMKSAGYKTGVNGGKNHRRHEAGKKLKRKEYEKELA